MDSDDRLAIIAIILAMLVHFLKFCNEHGQYTLRDCDRCCVRELCIGWELMSKKGWLKWR